MSKKFFIGNQSDGLCFVTEGIKNQLKSKFVVVVNQGKYYFLTKPLLQIFEKKGALKKDNFNDVKLSQEICDGIYFFNGDCVKNLNYKIDSFVNPSSLNDSKYGRSGYVARLFVFRGLITGKENKAVVVLSDPDELKILNKVEYVRYLDIKRKWGNLPDSENAFLSHYNNKLSKIYPIDEILDDMEVKIIR